MAVRTFAQKGNFTVKCFQCCPFTVIVPKFTILAHFGPLHIGRVSQHFDPVCWLAVAELVCGLLAGKAETGALIGEECIADRHLVAVRRFEGEWLLQQREG